MPPLSVLSALAILLLSVAAATAQSRSAVQQLFSSLAQAGPYRATSSFAIRRPSRGRA